MSQNNLATNLKYLRKKAKISQHQLAQDLGLTRSNIASYESGRAEPKASYLASIALYFEVDLIVLIDGDVAQTSPSTSLSHSNGHSENGHYQFNGYVNSFQYPTQPATNNHSSNGHSSNGNGHHSNGHYGELQPMSPDQLSIMVETHHGNGNGNGHANGNGNGHTFDYLVTQCNALKRMLEGFREFHKFRAADVRNADKVNQGVYNDYENLLRVMETMLHQHENILHYVQKSKTD